MEKTKIILILVYFASPLPLYFTGHWIWGGILTTLLVIFGDEIFK